MGGIQIASCRRADAGGSGGEKGNTIEAQSQLCFSNRRLRRRPRRLHPRGPAFSSRPCRFLLLGRSQRGLNHQLLYLEFSIIDSNGQIKVNFSTHNYYFRKLVAPTHLYL